MELRFLGPFEVGGPSGRVLLGSPKERLLVALLALRANQVVSTAQIVDGLWGEKPPPTAVKTLHAHVSRVRRRLDAAGLPDVIVTREAGYLLVADPEHIDAVRFERHARAARHALAEGDARTADQELAAGLALWRGEALAGCRDGSGAVAGEAVRLDELRLSAIEDHVDALLALGRHTAVVGDLESQLARHPLRERMWGALMVALYRSHRQADALRAYQRARVLLVEKLGVEPSAELRRLEAAILDGDPRLDLDAVTPSASARLVGWATSGPTFVGRDAELTALRGLWHQVSGGDRQVVMIGGEPGIGKTRLAAETAVLAHDEGARVLFGRCDEGLGVPYQPFVEAFREYVDACSDDELAPGLGRYPGELVRLVPELAPRMSDLEPPLHSDPATEQYRLFEAVVEWLAAAVQRAPVVLVLDDLHWAAQPTVLLLRHVVRSGRAGRFMVLGTYRQSELDQTHPLAEMLADAHVSAPAPKLDRFDLRGLDASAVAAFVEAAAGHELGEAGHRFAESVHIETAGNPFFVNEIVRNVRESGAFDPNAIDDWPSDVRIPSAARDVVLRRVARLSTDAQHVLTLAAVVGSEFDVGVFEGLADLDANGVLNALEEAGGARLVDEAGPNRFAFAHAIVRGALYDRLSASRRARLHGRVADALERLYASDLDEHLSELAYHYADADSDKAVGYALDAAGVALDRLAFQDAVDICRRGLAAVERARLAGASVVPSEECDLLLALGRAQLASGQSRGRVTLLRAYEAARAINDARRQAASVLAMNRGFFSRIGRTDRELVDALEATIAAQPPGDTADLSELLATLASELVWAPDGERRFDLSDRALAMARRVGDSRNLARVLMLRSMTIPAPDTLDERLAACGELLELGEELGDPAITFDTAFSYSGTAWEVGDVPTINHMEEIATALAAELRQPRLEWQASFMRTARRLLEGSLEEAERNAELTFELGQRAGQEEAFIFYTEQMLEIRRWQHRLAEVIDDYRELAGNDAIDFGYSLTRCLYDSGEHDAARVAYDAIMDRLVLPPRRDLLAITTLYNVAYLAVRFGDQPRTAAIYPALLPYASVFTSTTVARPVGHHFLGMLASTSGQADLARRHFEAAAKAHSDAQAPLLLAETRLEHARVLVGTDCAELPALVDAVRTIATAHRADYLQRGCDEIDLAR